jgi:hypothetical protein
VGLLGFARFRSCNRSSDRASRSGSAARTMPRFTTTAITPLAVDPGAARVAKQPACRGRRRCRRCRSPTRAVTKPRQLPMPARARTRAEAAWCG